MLRLRRIIVVMLVSMFAIRAFPVARAQTHPPGEDRLKAAALFDFAKLIDWPPSSFLSREAPFTICILGQESGHVLDEQLSGKMIGDRPLSVQRLKDKREARRCQMLFVRFSESPHLTEILDSLRGTNVLLAGETSGFAAAGGTIELTVEDNRVRVTINTDAADRAGLKLSSKLLALAVGIVSSPRSTLPQETGDPITVREIKTRVEPKYPELARQFNIIGKVRIEATVSPDGSLKTAHEIGGSPVLVKAALDALNQWKFENGPKETTEIIEIEFKGDNPHR